MNKDLASFDFKVPVDRIGEVLGKLNAIGSTLGELEPEDAEYRVAFAAQIPDEQIAEARKLIDAIPSAEMTLRT